MSLRLLAGSDGPSIPWALLVLLLPLLGRLVRALLERVGLVRPEKEEEERAQRDPSSLRQRRAQQREEEQAGTDLFERLARGEAARESAAPERPASVGRRAPPVEVSLESEAEPEPLAVLGPERGEAEPGCVPEPSLESVAASAVSLEEEAEPLPLAAFEQPAGLSEAAPVPVSSRAYRLVRGDLRRALLLSEILGPPLSQRASR